MSLICENGGYQDPTDCGRCLCPDGFGGDDCTHVIAGDPGIGRGNKNTFGHRTKAIKKQALKRSHRFLLRNNFISSQ